MTGARRRFDVMDRAGEIWRRLRFALGEYACFNLAVAAALGLVARATRRSNPWRSFRAACAAHQALFRCGGRNRLATWMRSAIEDRLRAACTGPAVVDLFQRPGPTGGTEPASLPRIHLDLVGMVMKNPSRHADGRRERGVLLLKNNELFEWFRRSVDVESLLRDYVVVLEPSWSSYATPPLLAWCRYAPHEVVVMAPAEADRRFLERMATNLVPIPLGAGDWVDPWVFRPLGRASRRYGAVAVARLCHDKRLGLLFRAIERLGDPAFRLALLVPAGPSPARREILAEIRRRRLQSRIDHFERLQPAAVNDVYNDAKVNVLLSRQEGANRSLFEGFFAGLPGLVSAGHRSVPLDRFVPATGRVVEDRDLPAALAHFRDHWAEYDPRPWALENIAAAVSSERLQDFLERRARERGDPWTRGIVRKCNVPGLSRYPAGPSLGGLEPLATLLARYPRREAP